LRVAKPAIALSAPTMLYAGQQHHVEIELTPQEAIRVDYVEARVIGKQGWETGSGKSRVSHAVVYPRLETRFMDRGVLPAGPTRFAMEFALPRDTAPSHQIDPAHAQLELHVRIAIPWWFDIKYRYFLPVHLPPPPQVIRTPVALRSTHEQAAIDKPRIEVALASTRLIVGEVLRGSVAVFHLADDEPREVDLELVPELSLFGRGKRERSGAPYAMTMILPAGSAGQAVPFSMALPPQMTPSFASHSHALGWTFRARSGSFFGGKVGIGIALDVVDASAAATTAQLAEAPRLADERIAAVFALFAGRRGWQGRRLDADDDDTSRVAIERETDHGTLRLDHAYRPDGTFLIARVATRSLGLGLSVTPASSIRHVFWKDIEVDITDWDRAHHVTARSAEQTIPALRAVVPMLAKLGSLGTMTRWTDEAIVFERAASDVEERDLAACEEALEAVAASITAGRLAVSPPPGLPVELAPWLELARKLDGELVAGDLSISGKLGHVPVEVGLVFDEDHQPVAFSIAVGNPEDASAAARAVELSLARPATDVLGANVAEGLVDQLTRWSPHVVELRVANGVAMAQLRLPTGAPADAAGVRALIEGLVAVLATLDPGAGPYR
jgi:hypothetical protein